MARPYTESPGDAGSEAANQNTLGDIINLYKGTVTRVARKLPGLSEIVIWQGRYHDHIIRGDGDLKHIREYIYQNPARWRDDRFFVE